MAIDDPEAAIAAAGDRLAGQSLERLRQLIGAARDGPAAIEGLTAGALAAAGCAIETFDYDPQAVPMVEEFASSRVTGGGRERCVVGRIGGAGGGRSLILFAHPDTEAVGPEPEWRPEPAWRSDPFVPTMRAGRLYGWGVADDLAGLGMLVQSLELLRHAGFRPKGEVRAVSAPSKKHRRGIGAALHRGLEADAAVYLHPAESGRGLDEIKAFAPGQLEFAITIQGRPPDTSEPAHTAFAHRAVNPFDKAMIIAQALRALDGERGRDRRHPTLEAAIGRSANLMLSACDYGADDRLSRIAPSCRLGGAMTLVPGETLGEVIARFEQVVGAAAGSDPWLQRHPPAIEWLAGVSAAETVAEAPIYQTVADVLRGRGASPRVNPLHTSSDIRNPIVQKGIPTVGFGPLCGGLAMSGLADEWVDVADYQRAIVATALTIATWCGTA